VSPGRASGSKPPAKGRGRAAGLTRAAIVDAALAVIDSHGVEGLTMRRLGQSLGVDPMAIYWHLDGKAAVLDAVVEQQAARLGELGAPLPTDPVELMVAIGQHFRRVLLEHPNLAPILASRPLPQPDAPALVTFGVSLLRAAGFSDEDIPLATGAIATFGLGFALQEAATAAHHARELGPSFQEQQESVRAQLAASDRDTSLEEAAIAHRLSDGARDAEFESGLRAMLHGLRIGLGRPPTS
jgi:TetR/AcrR family tetracycline transcriptional repressor